MPPTPKSTPAPVKVTTPEELGAVVRAVRREAGIDQARAAGLAGVGTRFLGDLERGKPTSRLGLVLQVLDRLGLELTVSRRAGGRRAGSAGSSGIAVVRPGRARA